MLPKCGSLTCVNRIQQSLIKGYGSIWWYSVTPNQTQLLQSSSSTLFSESRDLFVFKMSKEQLRSTLLLGQTAQKIDNFLTNIGFQYKRNDLKA